MLPSWVFSVSFFFTLLSFNNPPVQHRLYKMAIEKEGLKEREKGKREVFFSGQEGRENRRMLGK